MPHVDEIEQVLSDSIDEASCAEAATSSPPVVTSSYPLRSRCYPPRQQLKPEDTLLQIQTSKPTVKRRKHHPISHNHHDHHHHRKSTNEDEIEEIVGDVMMGKLKYYVAHLVSGNAQLYLKKQLDDRDDGVKLLKEYEEKSIAEKKYHDNIKKKKMRDTPSAKEIIQCMKLVQLGDDGLPVNISSSVDKSIYDCIRSGNFTMNDHNSRDKFFHYFKHGSSQYAMNNYVFGGLLSLWKKEAFGKRKSIIDYWMLQLQERFQSYSSSQLFKFLKFFTELQCTGAEGRMRFLNSGYSFEKLFNITCRSEIWKEINKEFGMNDHNLRHASNQTMTDHANLNKMDIEEDEEEDLEVNRAVDPLDEANSEGGYGSDLLLDEEKESFHKMSLLSKEMLLADRFDVRPKLKERRLAIERHKSNYYGTSSKEIGMN